MCAILAALAQWRSMRTCSVLVERSSKKQSMGLGTAPTEFWRNLSRPARSSSLVTSAPPITSE